MLPGDGAGRGAAATARGARFFDDGSGRARARRGRGRACWRARRRVATGRDARPRTRAIHSRAQDERASHRKLASVSRSRSEQAARRQRQALSASGRLLLAGCAAGGRVVGRPAPGSSGGVPDRGSALHAGSGRRIAPRTGTLFAHLGPHALLVQLLVFLASGALGALNRKQDRRCGETQSSDESGA